MFGPIVPSLLCEGGQHIIERAAQRLLSLGVVVFAEDILSESIKLERIDISGGHRQDQVGKEVAGLHVRESVHGRAAIDPYRNPLAVFEGIQLAGVAAGARQVQHVVMNLAGKVMGESDGQLVRICRGRFQVHNETVFAHVVRVGKSLRAPADARG